MPLPQPPKQAAKATFVYAGTYTSGKAKGIYAYWLQTEGMEVSQNITLVPLGLAVETSNPSFIECDAKRRLVFAVNADPNGMVSSFAADGGGKLKLLDWEWLSRIA